MIYNRLLTFIILTAFLNHAVSDTSFASNSGQKIKAVIYKTAPYGEVVNNGFKGIFVDYYRKIFDQAKITNYSIHIAPLPRANQGINNGDFDLNIRLNASSLGSKGYKVISTVLKKETLGIITRNGSGISKKSDLDNRKIGDFIGSKFVSNFNPKAKVVHFSDYYQAASLLKVGRIDGFFAASIGGRYAAKKVGIEVSKFIIEVRPKSDISLVISEKSTLLKDLKRLNKVKNAVKTLREENYFRETLDSYLEDKTQKPGQLIPNNSGS